MVCLSWFTQDTQSPDWETVALSSIKRTFFFNICTIFNSSTLWILCCCCAWTLWVQTQSSCVLFLIPNKVVSLSQRNTASPEHVAGGCNNTTARLIAPPNFIVYTFGRSYANLTTPWRRHVGACFRTTWTSLNFYNEYLFGFETLVFAASRIILMLNPLHCII